MAKKTDLIRILSQYSVASISQLATLLPTSRQIVRRWVRTCGDVRTFAGITGRGRPETWVALKSYRGSALTHEWQVTQFASELAKMCSAVPDLSWRRIPGAVNGLAPDLSFCIKSIQRENPILFFTEIDRGTEPIRRAGAGTDLERKLERYVELRATNRYRTVLDEELQACRGFRVLFVTPDSNRRKQLESLTRVFAGDFIWVTEFGQLAEKGVAGKIWTTGRKDEAGRSILGSLAAGILQRLGAVEESTA
jgi:hypothetical protein